MKNEFSRIGNRAGFTLLEILVVLLISSLATALLVQGFTMALRLRQTLVDVRRQQQKETLVHHWFTSAMAGLYPDHNNGPHPFRGNETSMGGLTLMPLSGSVGRPVFFELTLEENGKEIILRYRQNGQTDWVLASWPAESAVFTYLDESGASFSTWPPDSNSPQLPTNIFLTVLRPGSTIVIPGTTRNRRLPRIDARRSIFMNNPSP